jgi:hypothetical protein
VAVFLSKLIFISFLNLKRALLDTNNLFLNLISNHVLKYDDKSGITNVYHHRNNPTFTAAKLESSHTTQFLCAFLSANAKLNTTITKCSRQGKRTPAYFSLFTTSALLLSNQNVFVSIYKARIEVNLLK